jgi:hypothetical protein
MEDIVLASFQELLELGGNLKMVNRISLVEFSLNQKLQVQFILR